jgi:hypothetical protein
MKKLRTFLIIAAFLFAVSGLHTLHCEHEEHGDVCPFAFLTQGHYSLCDSNPPAADIVTSQYSIVWSGEIPPVVYDYTYADTLRSPPSA